MNIDIQNFYVSVRDLLKIKKNHVSELVWTQGDFLRKKLNVSIPGKHMVCFKTASK